jgi:putative oxidoreductase
MNDAVTLVSRALLSAIFIVAGFNKAMAIGATTAYLARLGVPKPSIVVWLAIAVELGGGLLVLVGFFTRWAALALAVFTAVSLYLAHKFWAAPPAQYMNQFNHAFKNIAMIGGFLLLAVHGPGRYSIDGRSR